MTQPTDAPVTDLTKGIYRRLYAGFIKGQRINKLSLQAEAWFWRVMATVDDFGNADAEPGLCLASTVGRRKGVTLDQVTKWLEEMRESGLIRVYADSSGDKYLHINGFEELQPAGKNGRRVRKFPPCESEGIQGNPDVVSASHSHSDPHSESHTDTEKVALAAKPRSPSKSKLCDEEYINELQSSDAYSRLDVRHVLGKMVAWCENNGKQPTRSRLLGWLNREDQPIRNVASSRPAVVAVDLPPLPKGVRTWGCFCGFRIVQDNKGITECPDCKRVLMVMTNGTQSTEAHEASGNGHR